MNKEYWQLVKITPQELYQIFLTDEDRERIKRNERRAMRFISSAFRLALGMELESVMRMRA